MKQNRLKEIVKELRAASKMHAGQATEISEHVKDMAKGASRSSFGPAQTRGLYPDNRNNQRHRISFEEQMGVEDPAYNATSNDRAKKEQKEKEIKETAISNSQEIINENQQNIKAPTIEEYARLTAENVDKNKYVGPPKKKKNTCWKGYVAKGKKKSPSGKKNSDGSPKMVNNCVKISKKRR